MITAGVCLQLISIFFKNHIKVFEKYKVIFVYKLLTFDCLFLIVLDKVKQRSLIFEIKKIIV